MNKPYVPQSLPLGSIDWVRFVTLIGQANAELARYDGTLQGIINPGVLLSPLTTKEAVISSKIEGTQASLEDVLQYEASPDIKTAKYDDIREIINYRDAMRYAIQWMKEKPITLNLIKQMHSMLLDSVRGKDKGRGNFRTTQNYIGKPGAPIEQAKANSIKAKSVLDLYNKKKTRITELTHSQYAIKVLDTIFARPIFNTTDFITYSKIPKASAMRLLNILRKEKMLSTLKKGSGRRAEVLMFDKLINIVS